MPISKKDNLQKLLKSLSKNEKKIFRESLKNQSENSLYLQLFNLIDQKANPTQKDFKKLFDSKANQLGVIKKYLIKLILRSLKTLPSISDSEQKILQSFLDFQIYLEKDLLDLAESEIEKTLKFCRDTEKLTELLQALEYKKLLLIQKFGTSNQQSQKDINNILEEQLEIQEKLHNLHQYQKLQANFYDQFHQSSGLTRTVYTTLHTNPLLTSEHSPLSMQAKIIQAELLYSLHIFKDQDFQEAFAANQKILKQLELNSQYISEKPATYLNLLNQQLQILLHLRRFSEIPQLLQKIRQAPQTFNFDFKRPNLLKTTLETFQMELQLYSETKEFTKAHQLLPQIRTIYKDLQSPALKQWQSILNYEIARLHFTENNFTAALEVLAQLTKSPHSLREQETLLQGLYLNIVILVQQKNFLHLKKTLQQIEELFQTSSRKPQVAEKQLLRLLHNYPQYLLKESKQKLIYSELQIIKKTLEKRQNNILSELVTWLEEAFLIQSGRNE